MIMPEGGVFLFESYLDWFVGDAVVSRF